MSFVNRSYKFTKFVKSLGGYSQNFLCKFVKISVTLGLNILSFFKTKSAFFKQISLEVDINYIISSKIPFFDL